jgi:DNA polymerase III subunit epsilon
MNQSRHSAARQPTTTPNQFLRLQRKHLPDSARLAALVDVETTGFSSARDRIVEFAGVLFAFDPKSGRVLAIIGEYTALNDPGVPIPTRATEVHGIDQHMVQGHRLDHKKIDHLLADAEFVVAHNAEFDFGFLSLVSAVARSKPWRCSINGVSWASEGHDSTNLQTLLDSYGINPGTAHRALDDVLSTLDLLNRRDSSGHRYLKQLADSPPEGFTERASNSGRRKTAAGCKISIWHSMMLSLGWRKNPSPSHNRISK